MNRNTFLDAQFWLQRLDAERSLWPEAAGQHPPVIRQLLPLPSDHASRVASSAQSVMNEPTYSCSACFELDGQLCYFQPAHEQEDQTVLAIELAVGEHDGAVYLRFDRSREYQVSLSSLQSVILPLAPSTSASIPPFGVLVFECVSLRIWIDQGSNAAIEEARDHLTSALGEVEHRRLQSQKQAASSLQPTDRSYLAQCYRYNRWIGAGPQSVDASCGLSVKDLVDRGAQLVPSDAERDVVQHAINTVVATRVESTESASSCDITKRELVVLAAEIVDKVGADNARLRALLGTSPTNSCSVHKACLETSQDACTTGMWDQWEAFMDVSRDTFRGSVKRQKTSASDQQLQSVDVEDAACAFVAATVSQSACSSCENSLIDARERIRELEASVFACLFPHHPVQDGPKPHAQPETTNANASQRQPPLDPSQAEGVLSFLVESRRALVRQELATQCLPQARPV